MVVCGHKKAHEPQHCSCIAWHAEGRAGFCALLEIGALRERGVNKSSRKERLLF